MVVKLKVQSQQDKEERSADTCVFTSLRCNQIKVVELEDTPHYSYSSMQKNLSTFLQESNGTCSYYNPIGFFWRDCRDLFNFHSNSQSKDTHAHKLSEFMGHHLQEQVPNFGK